MKFSIKDFFSNCDQIRRKLRIWSHLLKKSLMENFIFCAVIKVMFEFIRKVFFTAITFFSFNVLNVNSLKCISLKNQECKVRPKIINNDLFYPFRIKVNICSGNCNSINYPYLKECVPDVIKNMNLKVFNMIMWKNETKQIK